MVWLTRATNLAPGLESNSATVDVVLAQLGVHEDGSLDPTRRTLQAINRMGDGATTVTPQGAHLARLDPWRDIVAFVTADDIPGTGDNLLGDDVYLSIGSQGNVTDRHLVWMSHTHAMTANVSLDMAWDPVLPPINRSQVAWIAHDELRTVDDLRIQRSAPFYPEGWSVINWVEAATPSSEPVSSSGLSADGRYAFWTTTESYQWGEPPTPMNLYRRQIAPPQSVPLTIHAVGGTVSQKPMGTLLANSTLYSTTTLVELTPSPAVG